MEQRLEAGDWPRHQHRTAYAAIVLSGGYLEAGGEGRFRVEAGDVVVHTPFDAHVNHLNGRAWVLNLPLAPLIDLPPVFQVRDLDELERVWREDMREVVDLLQPTDVRPALTQDWPDLLAAALNAAPQLSIGDWARARNLAPETVSRGFRSTFGVTPARYRAERRARAAWQDIAGGRASLAAVACDYGFADQAHMTRAITCLTGAPPGAWRRVNSIQDYFGA